MIRVDEEQVKRESDPREVVSRLFEYPLVFVKAGDVKTLRYLETAVHIVLREIGKNVFSTSISELLETGIVKDIGDDDYIILDASAVLAYLTRNYINLGVIPALAKRYNIVMLLTTPNKSIINFIRFSDAPILDVKVRTEGDRVVISVGGVELSVDRGEFEKTHRIVGGVVSPMMYWYGKRVSDEYVNPV